MSGFLAMPTDLKALVLKSITSKLYLDRLLKHRLLKILNNETYAYDIEDHQVRLYKEDDIVTVWSENFNERFDFTWEEIDAHLSLKNM